MTRLYYSQARAMITSEGFMQESQNIDDGQNNKPQTQGYAKARLKQRSKRHT